MQHTFGIIRCDSEVEIMDDDSPGKGSYMGLQAAILEGRRMMAKSPDIRQLNIYRGIQEIPGVQGRSMLVHQIIRKGEYLYG
ncbi:MAG: hypothetical protein R3B54_06900 [Bdellovibrionota bacterium]